MALAVASKPYNLSVGPTGTRTVPDISAMSAWRISGRATVACSALVRPHAGKGDHGVAIAQRCRSELIGTDAPTLHLRFEIDGERSDTADFFSPYTAIVSCIVGCRVERKYFPTVRSDSHSIC